MVYDLRNLQTNYLPVLGPNIPFLVLHAKKEVATKIVLVYMPIFVGNPQGAVCRKINLNPLARQMWVWLKLKLIPKGDLCKVSSTIFFFCKFLHAQP